MKSGDLGSLLRLRRQREKRAMGLVAARQSQHRHAESELAAAADAVSAHQKSAMEQERARLVGLIGQTLQAGQIATLQSSLNALADRHKDLVSSADVAAKACQKTLDELQKAQAEYLKRHRQAEKLSLLQSKLADKGRRRELAISEATNDELHEAKPAGEAAGLPGDR